MSKQSELTAAKIQLRELIGLGESQAKIAAARERLRAAEAAMDEVSHDGEMRA